MIKMKELPYPLDALEPYYNRETLDTLKRFEKSLFRYTL